MKIIGLYKDDLEKIIRYIPAKRLSILVTGATGLIGSCIIDALLYAKHEYKRDYTVYALGRSEEKLKKRINSPDVQFIVQDVQQAIPDDITVDYIISAASNADPRTYALYPAETITTNILGTINALEYAKKHGTRVLFTSTMEVYGEINKKDKSENDFGLIDFNRVRSSYPESKRIAELLCRCYWDEHKVETVIARLGYIYGPTMSDTDNKVVAQFIRKVISKDNIVLKSEGLQRRSYCYVADVVCGIFTVLFRGITGEVYNVASEKSITIKDMAQTAADIAGTKVVFELPSNLEKKGSSVVQDAVLNIEKICSLGWKPEYNLKDGFIRTVQILQEQA